MTNQTQDSIQRLRGALDGKYLHGTGQYLDLILIAFLARGHVLVEGPPGTAKTLTAKLLAHTLGKVFKRIQFTTDMLPGDIVGSHVFLPNKQEFKFIPGPIFADFIVADEINRTPPRTQSALLEAMEERQVTIEGETHKLSDDFFVIATQNPFDYEGTFPLPEVQLDRFLFKIVVDHGSPETEQAILKGILDGVLPPKFNELSNFKMDRDALDKEIQAVGVDASLLRYISHLLEATRKHPMVQAGASVRGGIALARAARINAILSGRDFVIPDDVKTLIGPVLRHRIKPNPEAMLTPQAADKILAEISEKVEFPK